MIKLPSYDNWLSIGADNQQDADCETCVNFEECENSDYKECTGYEGSEP